MDLIWSICKARTAANELRHKLKSFAGRLSEQCEAVATKTSCGEPCIFNQAEEIKNIGGYTIVFQSIFRPYCAWYAVLDESAGARVAHSVERSLRKTDACKFASVLRNSWSGNLRIKGEVEGVARVASFRTTETIQTLCYDFDMLTAIRTS